MAAQTNPRHTLQSPESTTATNNDNDGFTNYREFITRETTQEARQSIANPVGQNDETVEESWNQLGDSVKKLVDVSGPYLARCDEHNAKIKMQIRQTKAMTRVFHAHCEKLKAQAKMRVSRSEQKDEIGHARGDTLKAQVEMRANPSAHHGEVKHERCDEPEAQAEIPVIPSALHDEVEHEHYDEPEASTEMREDIPETRAQVKILVDSSEQRNEARNESCDEPKAQVETLKDTPDRRLQEKSDYVESLKLQMEEEDKEDDRLQNALKEREQTLKDLEAKLKPKAEQKYYVKETRPGKKGRR